MSGSATPADGAERWDAVLADWREGRAAGFLRAYSDAVNRRLLEEWLPPGRAGRILKTDLFDEAVGEGLLPTLAERAEALAAVDISPAVVQAAASSQPLVDARCADVRRMPFASGSFDVVVSNSTLDHFDTLQQLRAALAEIHRVLAPSGVLLITLDNLANPFVLVRNSLPPSLLRKLRLVPYPVGVTCRPRQLRRLLEESRFEVDDVRGRMHCPRLLARAAAGVLPSRSDRLLRMALALERLEAAPTRSLTAQFVSARARRA